MTIEREFCEGGLVSATPLRKPQLTAASPWNLSALDWRAGAGAAKYMQDLAQRDARVARAWTDAQHEDSVWRRCAVTHQEIAARTAKLARWAAGVDG